MYPTVISVEQKHEAKGLSVHLPTNYSYSRYKVCCLGGSHTLSSVHAGYIICSCLVEEECGG